MRERSGDYLDCSYAPGGHVPVCPAEFLASVLKSDDLGLLQLATDARNYVSRRHRVPALCVKLHGLGLSRDERESDGRVHRPKRQTPVLVGEFL